VFQWPPLESLRPVRCESFLEVSDRDRPSKLIKNQNTSTTNADKLKAKMSETIISSAPPAFNSGYLGDELGSLSSCRSRYATMINRTPINPVKSNQVRFRVIGSSRSMCDVFRVTDAHRTVAIATTRLTRRRLCYPAIASAALENFGPTESSYSPQRPSSQPTWLSSLLQGEHDVPVRDLVFSWISWQCSVSSRRLLAPENSFRLTQ